jgi:UDP-N-acetylglucosamine--N-acetylmuramyl-(pentapeptide) pyrophosphoryl-undecaprenol N-acetylglucosamine transferase
VWLGSAGGPEGDLVTREGIAFAAVSSAPIAGVGLRALIAPFKIVWGVIQSIGHIRRFRPEALLITGGWVCIPAALACWLLGVPVIITVPDIQPGGAINILKHLARRVGVVAPESLAHFRPGLAVEVGYPLREEMLAAAGFDGLGQPQGKAIGKAQAREYFGLTDDRPVLLVTGGSTGARSINMALAASLPQVLEGWQVLHISGRLDDEAMQAQAADLPPKLAKRYHQHAYLHSREMALALVCADLAVARAGASVLGEFPLMALPAILVPYPYAWRTQKVNADRLAGQGAALRLEDERLSAELAGRLAGLAQDAPARAKMSAASHSLRRPDAAARMAGLIKAVISE